MADTHPPAKPTPLPTSNSLSFSVEHSLARLEAIFTNFWAKLETRAAASVSQQGTADQLAEPCGVSAPPPDTEGKQAPAPLPLYSLEPNNNQGPTPPHQRPPTAIRRETHRCNPYEKDTGAPSHWARKMKALDATRAQLRVDTLSQSRPSAPTSIISACLVGHPARGIG
ncbi:Hypothetical predicted protein [Pelobates cultripes]|uniref:Uncharacterized protein n=1 Tax=Pelobates cultripes TaxID=61616 RepID=A0AAD1TDU4_PELCU|nr:Hypothetical predicted protein [Pelobates cultripes]